MEQQLDIEKPSNPAKVSDNVSELKNGLQICTCNPLNISGEYRNRTDDLLTASQTL